MAASLGPPRSARLRRRPARTPRERRPPGPRRAEPVDVGTPDPPPRRTATRAPQAERRPTTTVPTRIGSPAATCASADRGPPREKEDQRRARSRQSRRRRAGPPGEPAPRACCCSSPATSAPCSELTRLAASRAAARARGARRRQRERVLHHAVDRLAAEASSSVGSSRAER